MLILGSKVTRFELPYEQGVAPYFRFSWITGGYEREIVTFYTQILRPGMRVVDVGANIGYHTFRFAQLVGPKGKVFAFEPCPSTYEILLRNIRRRALQNVVVEQKAVSDTNGWIDLYLGRDEATHSTVQVGNARIKVESVSIDEYFARWQDDIHLVKIDVEGAELKVLRGMQSLMNRFSCMTLILEFYPHLLRMSDGEDGPIKLLSLLSEKGFYLYEIRYDRRLIALENYGSFEKFISSVRKLTNLLASRNPWQELKLFT